VSTAIGRAALVLTTNSAGLKSGLAGAGADVKRWGDSVGSLLKGAGVAAGLATAGAVAGFKEVNDTLAEMARGGAAAKAFGLTAEQFTGMAGIAESVGGSQREFVESLVTLGKLAAEGAAGKGEVAVAWFEQLNLNAQEFKQLRLDEQFFKVWEAISKLPADQRVRPLMVAFGEDGGKQLLSLLAKTPAELRRMAAGFEISTSAVERATAANESWKQAQQGLTVAWREFAVEAAPAVEGLIRKATELAGGFTKAAQAIRDARAAAPPGAGGGSGAEQGSRAGRFISDFWDHLPTTSEVGPAFFTALESQADAWAKIGNAGAEARARLHGLLTGTDRTAVLEDTGRAERFLDALNKPPPGPDRGPGWVARFREQARAAAEAADQVWRRADLARWKLEGMLGRDLGVGILRSLPLVEALGERVRAVGEAADHWFGGRGDAGPWAAVAKAAGALERFDNPALVKGSAGEISVRARHEMGGSGPQGQVLQEARRQTGHLKGIEGGVKQLLDRLAEPAPGLLPF
jgi:hypothetical protein